VAEVITLVKENGGLEYAKQIMKNFHNDALSVLDPFDNNKAKEALILLLDFVVNRKK
jgi:octaprenyl-diphosphate synthase